MMADAVAMFPMVRKRPLHRHGAVGAGNTCDVFATVVARLIQMPANGKSAKIKIDRRSD